MAKDKDKKADEPKAPKTATLTREELLCVLRCFQYGRYLDNRGSECVETSEGVECNFNRGEDTDDKFILKVPETFEVEVV
jgi:hypothetical protein